MKFDGSLEDLQSTIQGCGFHIESVAEKEHGHQLRTKEGAIVNWFPSTGTVNIQGKKTPREKLTNAWCAYTGDETVSPVSASTESAEDPTAPTNPTSANKKVFVVHGHDDVAREQLELILHKLGLDPFVLANTGGGGLTIIEALEKEIGPNTDQARWVQPGFRAIR